MVWAGIELSSHNLTVGIVQSTSQQKILFTAVLHRLVLADVILPWLVKQFQNCEFQNSKLFCFYSGQTFAHFPLRDHLFKPSSQESKHARQSKI